MDQTVTSISRVVISNGSPASVRTAKHSRIASAMFASASASLRPWLTQARTDGHSATKTPSSS
jgi:hypothetical protein